MACESEVTSFIVIKGIIRGKKLFGCLTASVDCNDMCYMPKHQEIAKFSRIFDDSSPQKV